MNFVIINTVNLFFEVLSILLIVRILLSWVRVNQYSKWVIFLYQVTDPILEPCKRLVSKMGVDTGMIDFSPIIAFLLIGVVRQLVVSILAFIL